MLNDNFSSVKYVLLNGPWEREDLCNEPSIDSVVSGELNAPAADVWARDPETFIAGEPHRHPAIWDTLTLGHPQMG